MHGDERPAPEPFAAFRARDFVLFQLGRMLSTIGMQMQGVAVAWQVYAMTGRALDLGYVGLAQFLPAFLLSLATGSVADRFDRRLVLIACHVVLTGSSICLWLSAGHASVASIYVVLVFIGASRAFSGPAGQALMPNLVPTQHFQNAIAWGSSIWQVAVVVGPAAGGLLYGHSGAGRVYVAAIALELATLLVLILMRSRPTQPRQTRDARAVVAGVRYVWQNPIILGAISLDLFAVLLGGAVALLPVYARDILHTGPIGLGLLRSAPAAGAIIIAIALAYRPLRRRAGVVMLGCVALFGAATIVFGVSHDFTLSLCALLIAGGADMVSVFVRQTLVLLNTPDEMRGRVSAVSLVFIGASNELGEFESGLTAAWLGAVPAVVIGGIGTCLVVLVWSALFPDLRKADQLGGT
ncbi:MAG TPA: MFS transporter [Polyangiaceae bacterium]